MHRLYPFRDLGAGRVASTTGLFQGFLHAGQEFSRGGRDVVETMETTVQLRMLAWRVIGRTRHHRLLSCLTISCLSSERDLVRQSKHSYLCRPPFCDSPALLSWRQHRSRGTSLAFRPQSISKTSRPRTPWGAEPLKSPKAPTATIVPPGPVMSGGARTIQFQPISDINTWHVTP